ncbi:hypothetical protein GQ55_6G113300 [Panicum hallii var. hallii]|nr:hypothetical protein GQ55_6G113300 [Panicum hallii var. hallii]
MVPPVQPRYFTSLADTTVVQSKSFFVSVSNPFPFPV